MAAPATYALLSLPLSTFDSSDREDALSSLRATVGNDNGQVQPFSVPKFKIGTLDALVQQADDLAKLDNACATLVGKVADSLNTLLDGDTSKIADYQIVNDSMQPLPLCLWMPGPSLLSPVRRENRPVHALLLLE